MSRRKKDPLRPFTENKMTALQQISRSQTAPAVQVSRAKILLLVAEGSDYQTAARAVGRNREAVSDLISRFNQEGIAALTPRHGGGPPIRSTDAQRERILKEAARTPTPEQDGCAVWSLSTLQKALRTAPEGLPRVSTFPLWHVLKADGQSHPQNRTWCETGTVQRKRKDGIVTVTDPDTDAKKNGSKMPTRWARRRACPSGVAIRRGRCRRSRRKGKVGSPRGKRRVSRMNAFAMEPPKS